MSDGIALLINQKEIDEVLKKLEKKVSSLKEPFTEIGEVLVSSTKLRFRTSTDPDGEPWEPLTDVTKELRRGGPPFKPLVDTGVLRNSIVANATDKSLQVGTNVSYAPLHQIGGVSESGSKVPDRPFLGLSERDKANIIRVLNKHLKGV